MFFKTRRYLKNNNDVLFKRNTELNKMCIMLQQGLREKEVEINKLKETNRDIENELVITSEILSDKKNEVKRLKTLLTKNNIEYRKEN